MRLLQVWAAVKLLNAMGMYGTARQLHYGYLGELRDFVVLLLLCCCAAERTVECCSRTCYSYLSCM
jgi:hypothetical protein